MLELVCSRDTNAYLEEVSEIINRLDRDAIDRVIKVITEIRNREGRIFFLGIGGSAANCSHAVNDFRKIIGIECYAPADNISELTARTNDDGWSTVFSKWLEVSHLSSNDAVFVLSVGGGSLEKNVSPNIVEALKYAARIGASILGIVGRDGGYTAEVADACIVIPTVNASTVTAHTEAFQGIIWHLMVNHSMLKQYNTKWESIQ
jgi:D-sedoheptulose 7-phosphate isomerase